MRICIDHYRCSNEIIYVIHDNLTYYRTDFAISKFLGLDKKEYKKRLKKIGPHTTDYMGEIYLKQTMSDEKFIDAFEKEFAAELILIRLANAWFLMGGSFLMEICLEHYSCSYEMIYVLYVGNKRYGTDLTISKCLGLDIDEYRKRLTSMGISYVTDGIGEIYLKQTLTDEQFIDIFKNEFVKELTLLKLSS